MATWVEDYEGSEPSSDPGQEGGAVQNACGELTFTDWLDLDSYFREWLVHQSSDKSDLKVEMSHRGVREVLQMDLRARTVELGDKSRMVGQDVFQITCDLLSFS